MAIRLIAIDMDGTLLTPDHQISPAVKSAIHKAQARGSLSYWLRAGPILVFSGMLQSWDWINPGSFVSVTTGHWYSAPKMAAVLPR